MALTKEQAGQIKENLFSQLSKLPKEQVSGLKDKIKSMNEEELEEFVSEQREEQQHGSGKKQCLFCQIANGLIDTIKVYEDDKVLAIMDIMPAKPGQVIVIPKKHYQFLFQLPEDLLLHIINITSLLEEIVVNVTKSNGINMHISQGKAAEQTVPHFAINLIPRKDKDDISFSWPRKQADKAELKKLADEMSERIKSDLKIKEEKREKMENLKVDEKVTEKAIEKEKSEAERILEHVRERMP